MTYAKIEVGDIQKRMIMCYCWVGGREEGNKRGYTSSLILGVRMGGSTSMPMLAAVPAIILIADSMLEQFKSGNFSIAMVRNCSTVTFPTFSSFGSFEPFSAPARLFSSTNQLNKIALKLSYAGSQETIIIKSFNQDYSCSTTTAVSS